MKKTLDNFLRMTPETPEYNQRFQHYVAGGVNPTYYLDSVGIEEQQIAPLAAALDWESIAGSIDGHIVHMIASTEGTFSVYFVTDTTRVYGATTSGVTNLGFPTGSAIANVSGRLSAQNNTIFFTLTPLSVIYKMTQPSSAWTTCAGTALKTNSGVKFSEPFLDFVAVVDSTANNTTGHVIGKLDVTAFNYSLVGGIDVGTGWGIAGMTNLNNKYLAIAAAQLKSGSFFSNYSQNYIFLWNGIDARYNYSVKVPGKFIHMKVVDGVLYVAVGVSSGKTILYYLTGTVLRKYRTPQYSKISSIASGVPQPLFNYNSYIGINLESSSDLSTPQMILGNDEAGMVEFILSHGRQFDIFVSGFDSVLFAGVIGDTNSSLFYYPQTNNRYQEILYISLWIPVRNLAAIDIFYDTPPQGGSDAIHTTIYGRGEDIQTGTSITVLNDITPPTILNKTRTRLDLKGFTGDLVKIKITTTNGSWRPIIRKVVLLDNK